MEIYQSPRYLRQLKKLPKEIRHLVDEKTKLFSENPHDKRLKTHRLSGALKEFSAFSVNYSFRILFDIVNTASGKIARFYEIGDHDIYE